MEKGKKVEIITFKAEGSLAKAMRGMPNRSAFIRSAILAALDGTCPLCRGTGFLTSDQRRHWDEISKSHSIMECDECHAVHIVCAMGESPHVH